MEATGRPEEWKGSGPRGLGPRPISEGHFQAGGTFRCTLTSPTRFGPARSPLPSTLGRAGEILSADRQCAQPLAGGGKDRVRHSGLDHGRAGLADAAPFLARRWGDVDLRFGRVFEAHDRVGVEVALLDPAVLDRDL